MSDPPRDPLAEHPIAPDASRRRSGARATLDLFPASATTPAPTSPTFGEPEIRAAADIGIGTGVDAGVDANEPRAVAFARRVAAGLADLLILALVGAVELAAGALLLDLRFPPPAFIPLAAFLLLAALVLLVLAPFVWGTTPGMALADLRIRAEDGGSPTLAAAFLRFAGFLLTGALAGVPLLVAAFDRRGRTLADLVSRTTIEPVEAPGAPEPSGLA